MKGAVFISLNEMVVEQHGMGTWEEILNRVNPPSQGIYISTENYEFSEIQAYVAVISEMLDLPPEEILSLFGHHLFGFLNKKYPIFCNLSNTLFELLNSVENVIHKEVRKLYEDASLPMIASEQKSDSLLVMNYRSPRKICHLAIGLISGAAEHYNEKVRFEHPCCMHKGSDHCLIEVHKDE